MHIKKCTEGLQNQNSLLGYAAA